MRFIGSKSKIINFIDEIIHKNVKPKKSMVFADLFAGTTVVSQHFKKLGYTVISNDYLTFSYMLQIAYLKNNRTPSFTKLGIGGYHKALDHLNKLKPIKGFFYRNYCLDSEFNGYKRNYFSKDNTCKIDSILKEIDLWKSEKLTNETENAILRTSLINAVIRVSNISGTYGAFLKKDDPRKYKSLELEPITIIPSKKRHQCYNQDIVELIHDVSGDILYLDPPYNQRQYPPYYHILETVSLSDKPLIYGKTGRRPYKDKLSPFCIKTRVHESFERLIENSNFEHIFLSYNTEGLLSTEELKNILSQYGNTQAHFYQHRRYRSNSNGTNHNNVKEILFYVRKRKH